MEIDDLVEKMRTLMDQQEQMTKEMSKYAELQNVIEEDDESDLL